MAATTVHSVLIPIGYVAIQQTRLQVITRLPEIIKKPVKSSGSVI